MARCCPSWGSCSRCVDMDGPARPFGQPSCAQDGEVRRPASAMTSAWSSELEGNVTRSKASVPVTSIPLRQVVRRYGARKGTRPVGKPTPPPHITVDLSTARLKCYFPYEVLRGATAGNRCVLTNKAPACAFKNRRVPLRNCETVFGTRLPAGP